MGRPRLLFVAPWFLFPKSNGGRIRTVDILRGMKGGRFEITLVSPDSPERHAYRDELEQICDRFVAWPAQKRQPLFDYLRLRHLISDLPVSVATDHSPAAARIVDAELAKDPDLAVFDFVHTSVLVKDHLRVPSLLFTHNVEAEIFRRHAAVASNPVSRFVWQNQHEKMQRFEKAALRRFDTVIAVSNQDLCKFSELAPGAELSVIPTGVDLDFFDPKGSPKGPEESSAGKNRVVFTGSMDWTPNRDAITFFMQQIWPLVVSEIPDAEFEIVGRNPPSKLVQQAARSGFAWRFSGYVEDVRPFVESSDVYAIPLRVGGGTRLKVFEAMAMGCPIVSTSIGVEGLPIVPDRHYLLADTPKAFAAAIKLLLRDGALRTRIAYAARRLVEDKFSAKRVARIFEQVCAATAGLPESSQVGGPDLRLVGSD